MRVKPGCKVDAASRPVSRKILTCRRCRIIRDFAANVQDGPQRRDSGRIHIHSVLGPVAISRDPTMTTIKATIRNGRIEVDAPIDLPDGTELTIPIPNLVPPVGIQVYSALIVQGLPLQPEAVGKRLQAFYSRVDELYATSGGAAEPEDQKPGSEVFRYL